jgi:hypothetical protein
MAIQAATGWWPILIVLGLQAGTPPTPATEKPPSTGVVIVLEHDQGGVIALKGDRQVARQDARKRMLAHCKGPYRVVSQGNVAVGVDSSQPTEPRAITEYRITYRCAAASAAAPR